MVKQFKNILAVYTYTTRVEFSPIVKRQIKKSIKRILARWEVIAISNASGILTSCPLMMETKSGILK